MRLPPAFLAVGVPLAFLMRPLVPPPVMTVGVSVSPANGTDPTNRLANSTGNTDTFTVTNTGDVDTRYSGTCTVSGNVTSVSCTAIGILIPGQQKKVIATFSVGGAGTGSVTLSVTCTSPTGCSGSGKWNITVVNPAASVTPDGASMTPPPNTASSYIFTVTNTGTVRTTYSLVAVCSGQGVSGCSPSPTGATLDPGASQPDTVRFTSGGVGSTGTVELDAQVGGSTLDGGTVSVTVPPPPGQIAPGVDVTVNPDAVLARGPCLSIALASASASECGDLRIAHPLPSVRTMNVWRTPTLVYNSAHAIGWVSLGANVTLAADALVPTTVSAVLKIGGVTRASGSWAGNQWMPGATRRIALGFTGPAPGLGTGVYDYTLEVTSTYPDWNPSQTVSGKLVLVDRSTGYFGAGWWLAGLEQWSPGTGVWIGGDGSARQYVWAYGASPNRVWGAPSVTYPDTIREVGSEFVRQLPDSVWVFFDAQGRHVRTKNRQGHLTTFAYTGDGKLMTITLPPASSPLSYNVTYDGNGRVSTIVAPGVPASRTTTLTMDPPTGRLTGILEPDGRSVTFGYSGDQRITARNDRRSTATSFQYDVGNRVSQASIDLAPGTITRTLQQERSRGFAGTAVALSDVFTRLDGPRTVNTTSFYVNRYGAPDSIIDALGQRTRFWRGDARFQGAVTILTTVTGHTITVAYDDRGRIQTSSEPSTSGQTATTTYTWDTTWDQATRITNPEGDFTDFGVDPVTGNRIWQQDGRGISARTSFQYYTQSEAPSAVNLIKNVVPPNLAYNSFAYDAKGNLNSYFTGMDLGFAWTNNDIGLTTQIQTPTGPCCHPGGAPYQIQTISYSLRNEDTLHVTSLTDQTTVRKAYDEEGNLLSVTRTFSPNQAGISPLTTSWQYDRANRPTRQTEPDGSVEQRWYDVAGDLDSVITRRGFKISMTYDALNRLSTRSLPQVNVSLPPSQIYPATGVNGLPYSYTWTADNQTFQYYADGQVSLATNRDATVSRSYHPNGRLLSETLEIKSTDRATSHPYTTTYRYDRNGRRSSVLAPTAFAGDSMLYRYDPGWGALTSVKDLAGNLVSFTYNDMSELATILYPGQIRQDLTYDADSRVTSDTVRNTGSQAFPRYPGPLQRSFRITNRNARGQILTSSDAVMSDQVTASYTGLGYLLTSNLRQSLVNGATGSPATYASGDTVTYDGLGNVLNTAFRDSVNVGGGWTVTQMSGSNAFSTTTGRLNIRLLGGDATTYSYDGAGNTYFQQTTSGVNVPAERAAYYASDDKLAASDPRGTGRRTFEEYRYDALGRRVWVKGGTTCEPPNAIECFTPYVRRTVWDGAQELAEIQVPVDTNNAQVEEMDTGYALQPYQPAGGSYGDPNPFYGRVVYSPGLAVDQPLSVTRYDYRDYPNGTSTLTWPRFSWQVYWNYQGLAAYGTLTTGAWAYPYQLGGGQTSCPALGNTTTQRCVIVQWPLMHSAYDQNRGQVRYQSWHGSLLEGKRDKSGLEYKRNRQYDPQTGRFTQEDPIGLAGGLNLYGFANGDPVNFSDPFGLCPPNDLNLLDCDPGMITALFTAGGGAAGGVAGAVIGGAGCLATVAGAIVCGAGGAAAGAAAGAKAGAFVGSAVDLGIQIAKMAQAGKGGGGSPGGGKPKIQPGETGSFDYAVRKLGLDRNAASDLLHQLKRAAGLRGGDNVWINTATGEVRAQATGEVIGGLIP